MKKLLTQGIVLSRTDFGEADRIVTILTRDYGKLRLMARGVRKVKSKLAGGIELFSVSDITFIRGRGELGTLISTRLIKHYGQIVKDIERVQLGYELIKLVNRATEDEPETAYFSLLAAALAALDGEASSPLIRAWYWAQLLQLGGHAPNLRTDTADQKLRSGQKYSFDAEAMAFFEAPNGRFDDAQIKFLRLIFNDNRPGALSRIQGCEQLVGVCLPLVQAMLNTYVRV